MQCIISLLRRNATNFRHGALSGIVYRCKYSQLFTQDTFVGETDRFKGITVDTSKEKCNLNNLALKLEESLHKWKSEGNRCIWFKVNIQDAFYVPILAKKGFNFHHAREDFVMMYKWLPEDSEPNLPPSCHTNLGVGAMVFNDKHQILAVSEKHYDYPHWKLPGGYVERGEDIVAAAVREVKEETGIDASFLSLITLRHTHNMMFNNSDIYVLLMMKALSQNITISLREVTECRWMDINEYICHPHVHEFNKEVANKALQYRRNKMQLNLERKRVVWSKYTRDMNYMTVQYDYDY